jgi:LmbE family N-acetylglucosaminyl deacetylase
MMLTVGERDLGTPESAWLPRLAACPALTWTQPGHVVVLSPHPDDEVLAVGGSMHLLQRAGCSITVVAVTDGEASHPRAPHVSREHLAAWRAAERAEALLRMGVDAEVVRLRVPDGRVGIDLAERLEAVLTGAALCLAPWHLDGHPDHDATGHAAREACAHVGARLVQYPVWAWHWAKPTSNDLPWERARRVPLPSSVQTAKCAAIDAYRTQIAPLGPRVGEEAILPRGVLARFQRPFEIVFT